jgi:hypothetical protein
MKKHRICTTVSEKHWNLLKKNAEKFETQQNAIEHALESLEYGSKHSHLQAPEDKIWAQMGADFRKVVVIMQKDSYRFLLDNCDMDRFIDYMAAKRPMEFAIEYVYGKTLQELSLKELIEALIMKVKIQNSADMISYTDDGDHYSLQISHSLGLNHSRVLQVGKESTFKQYGVKTESFITDKSVFVKIYKNRQNDVKQ